MFDPWRSQKALRKHKDLIGSQLLAEITVTVTLSVPYVYRTRFGPALLVVYWLQLWGGALRIPLMRKNTHERDATLTGY